MKEVILGIRAEQMQAPLEKSRPKVAEALAARGRSLTGQAELYLLDSSGAELARERWESGHELSTTLLPKMTELLKSNSISFKDLKGVVVYKGPGSFTSLRVSIATANALAYGLAIPVVGSNGNDWLAKGLKDLKTAKINDFVMPAYGRKPHITRQKK